MLEPAAEIEIVLNDGTALEALQYGDGAPNGRDVGGSVWLALHGWMDNAGTFTPLMQLIQTTLPGPRPHRIICVDLPGHGRSAPRSDNRYHFADYVLDVARIADALHLGRFGLIGHSMGGAIAMTAAAGLGERVTALIMLDSLGPFTSPAWKAAENIRAAMAFSRSDATASAPHASLADACAHRSRRNFTGPLPLAAAEHLAVRGVAAVPGGGVAWRQDNWVKSPSVFYLVPQQVVALARAVQAPTLCVLATGGIHGALMARFARLPRALRVLVAGLLCLLASAPLVGRRVVRVADYAARVAALARGRAAFAVVRGDHHAHLTAAPAVHAAIAAWVRRVKLR